MQRKRSGDTTNAALLHPVPDLAGTPAADVEGEFFGEVYGGLAEVKTGLLRYLDLALHETTRHVLVPIGHVRVHRVDSAAEVRLRAASRTQLALIPAFDPEALRPGEGVGEALVDAHGRLFAGARYYAHPAFDHSRLYGAIEEPIVAGTERKAGPEGLVPVAPGDDVVGVDLALEMRGWPVRAADGENAGHVKRVIADPAANAVRYIEIEPGHGRPFLLPPGYLRRDPDAHMLRTPELDRADLETLPRASADAPTRAEEDALRQKLDRLLSGPRLYDRPDFRAA